MKKAPCVYSLGYEGISLDEYVEQMKSHHIATVVDVRETPWSYKKGFSKGLLSERLSREGIAYIHVKSAGNPSRNRKMGLPQEEVISLYRKHLAANESCLTEIGDIILEAEPVCLLCFEREPHDCHRKVIIDKLAERNKKLVVKHLAGHAVESKQQ